MRKYLFLFAIVFFMGNSAMAEVAPAKVTGATRVDTMLAKNLFDQKITFVDVRSEADFQGGHIPGAKNLSITDGFTSESLSTAVGKDKSVVFYCDGALCAGSAEAAKKALEWGWTKVFYFRDGLSGWKRAGLPIE